tara:strand:+ start:7645 stop:8625 length:981 start_codon:yes stop_codon:yes gene_type:complete
MAFISSARFIAKFDALPLIDSVSGNLFRVFGSSANILEGNLGFDMQQGQHIERDDVSLSVSNKMTVGFWLKPANPGQVRNSSTGDLESLNISLFDIREPTTTNDLILLVHERTDPDGVNNTLRAIFYDSSGADFVINSSKYSVDNWHHFWIVYDGPGSSVQLFIDGIADSLSTSGSVPGGLTGGSAIIAVNRLGLNPAFNVVDNQGAIDDLVVLNDADATDATIQKVINYSLDFAFNTDHMSNEEIDLTFLFSDPNAFHLTSVETDGTNILATRTDGKILEGSQLMWHSRKRFADAEAIGSLDIFGDGSELANGYLEIKGIATVSV